MSCKFYYCRGLTSVTIGNSVTSIREYAFDCRNLTDIYCHIEEPLTIASNVFSYVPTNTCMLHVPVGSKVKYQAADVWKSFLYIVEDLPTGIVSIDNSQSTIDNDVWFTLNGVRLNGKPTIPGIYIVNGLKVVIK
ncbi:MAG: leucine-rich repeat protein [Prevotella sp.]|nr:leucine-rich repeat protein [Prevotella sp.]